MDNINQILQLIKLSVNSSNPAATIILYGSVARGDFNENSDIDLLILLDKDNLTREDAKRIKYPLYSIEIDTGRIISPIVFSKKEWETKHQITPFYENVKREGIVL
jgi:uncharacterized protein